MVRMSVQQQIWTSYFFNCLFPTFFRFANGPLIESMALQLQCSDKATDNTPTPAVMKFPMNSKSRTIARLLFMLPILSFTGYEGRDRTNAIS
jgi:hypothetical protein